MNRPTQVELQRIAHLAKGAYGYWLPVGRVLDIWRLCYGLPVIDQGWPPKYIMRHIALDHLDSWPLVRPQA